jgi:hypothetical protein
MTEFKEIGSKVGEIVNVYADDGSEPEDVVLALLTHAAAVAVARRLSPLAMIENLVWLFNEARARATAIERRQLQ